MKEHIESYKKDLEKAIGEYMSRPKNERSADAVYGMLKCWMCTDDAEKKIKGHGEFTHEDAKAWADKMVGVDGGIGAHWTIEQTTSVAEANGVKFEHITDWMWNITMNMMYSDYYLVADKYGVDTPEFYADMAKAFLFDPDGGKPEEKLSAYYHGIVCKK